jgi:glycerol-3-phosphate acyltransferase PlsX
LLKSLGSKEAMIALDVMGGDHAPQAIVHGALLAAQQSIPITLFGPYDLITSLLEKLDAGWQRYPLHIAHADQVVHMDDDPVSAVKTKPGSSLVKAVSSVKQGICQAVVSAGSSGALMVASTLILGRQEGVGRAAIAGFLPTKKGKVLALDLGANTEVRPEHLYQFAHLGAAHVAAVSGIKRPRVALLANGHEDNKGSVLVKQAHLLLKESTLNFIGNAEPKHVLDHEMDVIVCDGFTGNVLLKTCEAATDMFSAWLAQGITKYSEKMSAENAQQMQKTARFLQASIDARLDYKQVGGALLLGVNGTVIVCHGSSDAQTMQYAITFAWRTITQGAIIQREIIETVQLS